MEIMDKLSSNVRREDVLVAQCSMYKHRREGQATDLLGSVGVKGQGPQVLSCECVLCTWEGGGSLLPHYTARVMALCEFHLQVPL